MADPASEDVSLAKTAYCLSEGHFYRPQARDLIGRLLRSYLDNVFLTPTELLHSSTYQQKFSAAGNFLEGAVQKAAIAQVKGTETSVTGRIKVLHALLDGLTARARNADGSIPLEGVESAQCLVQFKQALARPETNNRDYTLSRLMTGYLAGCESWLEKLRRIVPVFDDLSHNGATDQNLKYPDMILGEILRSKAALDQLLGETKSLEHLLIALSDLAEGEYQPGENTLEPDLVDQINQLFSSFKLPAGRAGLIFHVYAVLAGRTRLVSADVVEELNGVHRIYQHFQRKGELFGGAKTVILLERRVIRTLSVDNLGEKLRQLPHKHTQVVTLLGVHDIIMDHEHKKLVRNYLDYVLEDREFDAKLVDGGGNIGEKLQRFTLLHGLLVKSNLSDMYKAKYSAFFEDLQESYIKDGGVFAQIDKAMGDPAKKSIYLMELCGSNAFIEGKNLDNARKLIGHYILQPEFIKAYLAGATDPKAMETRINELKKKLLAAGIDETVLDSPPAGGAPSPASA